MEFWEQLKSFLSYSFLDVSLQRVVLALFVFLLIYSLRQLFSKLGMKFLRKISGYTKTTFDDHIVNILEPPALLFHQDDKLAGIFKCAAGC